METNKEILDTATNAPEVGEVGSQTEPQLELVDIKNMHMIIQHAIDRGAFKSDELIQVIPVYQRLTEFVQMLEQGAGE